MAEIITLERSSLTVGGSPAPMEVGDPRLLMTPEYVEVSAILDWAIRNQSAYQGPWVRLGEGFLRQVVVGRDGVARVFDRFPGAPITLLVSKSEPLW